MKKLILFLIALCTFSISLSAKPEIYTGIGLTSGRNYLSSEAKELIASGYQYDGDYKYFTALGPIAEVAFYPTDKLRLGIVGSASTNFFIGKSDGSFDRRRHGDMRWDLNGGVAFIQLLGSWGLFTDVMYSWRNYRVADSNPSNTKESVDFTTFSEHGILADLGIIVKNHHSFFKFGFAFNMPLSYKSNNGWSLDIFASGGLTY